MLQPERSPNGSEDQKSEICARRAVQRSSVGARAGGDGGPERVAPRAPVPRGSGDVDPQLRRRAAPLHGGPIDQTDGRAHLADRLRRRLQRRLEFQPRVQETLRNVARRLPGSARPQRGGGEGSSYGVRAASTNAPSLVSSSAPFVRTPLQTSSANGRTAAMASRTFSARKPPARNSGTPTLSRIRALSVQSCTRPVPPSSLKASD